MVSLRSLAAGSVKTELTSYNGRCDYTGSCSLVRRRSLLPVGPSKAGLGTDPYGCPDDLSMFKP